MANITHFDYIIIGNGLADLHLALKFASDSFFNDKQIALIDPSEKNSNDKTWSFWETQPSSWDRIVRNSWKHAKINTSTKTIALNLEPYTYKTIRAIDFYNYAKSQLNQHKNFQFILEEVEHVEDTSQVVVKTNKH